MNRDEIFKKIRAVGRAALTLDIENSHSGNISVKFRDERGDDLLAITATGSQKGELTKSKICFPALDKTNYGHFKASSETDIHAEVLKIPGLNATMHGHTKFATVVTLDDHSMPKSNPRAPLIPMDPLGARHLGQVPVDWFSVASGSKEMADTVAQRLGGHPVCIVQAHGTFAGGASLEQAFFFLCLVEHSGEIIHFSDILGAQRDTAGKRAEELLPIFKRELADYSPDGNEQVDFNDEPETVEMFYQTGYRIFESRYSPFHTGSMSIRCSGTMLYAPKASMPHELPGPLLEVPLRAEEEDRDYELGMHRMIYGSTPSIPVLPHNPDPGELAKALLDYRVVIVEFGGVWAAGEQSVGEALRHISSVKDVCFYRIMAKMRGLNITAMEPERAKNW